VTGGGRVEEEEKEKEKGKEEDNHGRELRTVVGESASITVLSFYEKKWVKSDNG
jgi:hypothetical protein